jgi:hypothetical protein
MARQMTSEEARETGSQRWKNATQAERDAHMEIVRAGRVTVKDVLAEIRALRAEVAELRSGRIAA